MRQHDDEEIGKVSDVGAVGCGWHMGEGVDTENTNICQQDRFYYSVLRVLYYEKEPGSLSASRCSYSLGK